MYVVQIFSCVYEMGSARLKVDTHFWQTNMHKKYQVPTYVVSEHTTIGWKRTFNTKTGLFTLKKLKNEWEIL